FFGHSRRRSTIKFWASLARTVALSVFLLPIGLTVRSSAQTTAQVQQLIQRGEAALDSGNLAEAEANFSQAIRLAPNDQSANRGLLLTNLESGRLQEAIDFGNKAVTRFPRDAQLQHWLGLAYFKSGQNPEALTWLHKALQLEPAQFDMQFDTALV